MEFEIKNIDYNFIVENYEKIFTLNDYVNHIDDDNSFYLKKTINDNGNDKHFFIVNSTTLIFDENWMTWGVILQYIDKDKILEIIKDFIDNINNIMFWYKNGYFCIFKKREMVVYIKKIKEIKTTKNIYDRLLSRIKSELGNVEIITF